MECTGPGQERKSVPNLTERDVTRKMPMPRMGTRWCTDASSVAASMGCPGYPWISLWFQYFRIRRHISPNPATYFDILLNNRTGVQLAGYPYDSKEMPPLVWGQLKCTKSKFNPVHVFLHFGTFSLVVLQLILASKLIELEQFENFEITLFFDSPCR